MFKDIIVYTPMYVTFFWAVVLLASAGKRNRAKKFLGIFMVAAFLVYLSHAVFFHRDIFAYIIFDPVYIFASLSVYPLYYWYIKLLTIETDYRLKNIRMFIPAALLSGIAALIYVAMSAEERNYYLHRFMLEDETGLPETFLIRVQRIVFVASRLVFAVQVVVFLFFGRKLVIRYNKQVANFYSNLENKTIVWVNLLLYSFVITSVMSIIFNTIGRATFLDSAALLFIPSFIFSVLLFLIGFQGHMQNHTVQDLVLDEKLQTDLNMKDYNQVQLKKKMVELFLEQKIYRQSDLKITQVSNMLKTNRTYVSNLINQEFSCSFSEFVNEYRIIEAKKMLEDVSVSNYSLDYISETSGFGSLTTFIRVFKDYEGITPGKYRDKYFAEN